MIKIKVSCAAVSYNFVMQKCVYIKGAVVVIYAVKLTEILIVVLLLNCGGFGKLQHFIEMLIAIHTSYSVNFK